MKVPLLDLVAQHQALDGAVEAAVQRVLASGQFVLGPEVAALESELAALHGKKGAVGVSSGSDALLVSLMALGVGPGDEVITTPLSFFSTAGAIARLGARPVFVDIRPETLNLDAGQVRITAKTKAIVPVHLFGRPAELDALVATGLPVVEDAAQAVGSSGIGAGKATTLSFFPSKNLGAAGDGGMVLSDDEAFLAAVRLLRTHGSHPKYIHAVLGGNFRLDALQAAVLRAKLPHLSSWNERRRSHAARYRQLLEGTPLGLPTDVPGHVWHHFVVRAPRREALRTFLKHSDVDTEVYYPLALHLQPCFRPLGYQGGDCPEAERATAEVLALPVHPDLNGDQIDFVSERVRAFYAGAA